MQSHAVALHILLNGHKLEEQIAVVEIEISHGVVILCGAFVEQLLVVDIARIDAQQVAQSLSVVDGIAHPRDIADVIAVALLQVEEDVHRAVVVACH